MSTSDDAKIRDAQHDLAISLEYLKKKFNLADSAKEFRVLDYTIDELNMRHLRLQQIYQGLTIFGQQQIVHIQSDGAVRDITGDYRNVAQLAVQPQLTKEAAMKLVREQFTNQIDKERAAAISAELMIYPRTERNYLAYGVLLPIWQDDRPINLRCFVDANTGELLAQIPELNINKPRAAAPIIEQLNRWLADN